MKSTAIIDILKHKTNTLVGKALKVEGWVRTKRGSKNVTFIALNDGSIIHHLQIVLDNEKFDEALLKSMTTGSCIAVAGVLSKSEGQGQSVELIAEDITVYGSCDSTYPLQKKGHSLEFLRENAHIRMRTNVFGAVFRIRHAMAYAIHKFFNDKGFYWLHTPIITASDCEGAGSMFNVTTFDLNKPPLQEDGTIDYSKDFFGRPTHLTVSGQLEGELGALALGKIYTFGPTFRAENSNTTRHLSEFWMMEPEMAFYDITDNMDLAEEMLKYLVKYAMDNCGDDLTFLSARREKEQSQRPANERDSMTLIERLNFILAKDFERITYTQAFEILKNSKPNKKNKFEFPVTEWGIDLQSEHERFLVEKHFMKPVIITDYPKTIKAFYMKQNEDGKTVRAMDVLFPQIGEIIGGSQREESYDKLLTRIKEMDIDEESLWWYLDTRKFGTAPHSGFGLGFERLLLFITAMSNIRDVIPFPRAPQSAEF